MAEPNADRGTESAPPPPAARGVPSDGRARVADIVLPACLPLLAVVALCKAFAAGTWFWWSWRFPFKWALLVYQDVAMIAVWALIGAIALLLARRSARGRLAVQWAFLLGSTLVALYAIAAVGVYSALRMPLTYPLLSMAGSFADVRSSVGAQVNWPIVVALVAGPIAYLGAVRHLHQTQWARRPRTALAILVILVAYLPLAAWGHRQRIAGGPDDALAASPHLVLLRSYLEHWRGHDDEDFAPSPARAATSRRSEDDWLTFGQRPPAPAVAPCTQPIQNIIVVVLESVGTQFMSLYGGEYPTTPCLQAEAAQSLVFNRFYCNAGYTLHATLPLVLSIYPGTGWKTYTAECPHLPGTTMAQLLRARGYRTAMMTGGLIDFKDTRRFFEGRGFDEVCGAEDLRRAGVGTMISSWGIDDAPLFDHLLQWIDRPPARPFYVLTWTQQTHHPYTLPPGQSPRDFLHGGAGNGEHARLLNLYLNDLYAVDQQLGRLFDHLRRRHLDQNTVVVITGDHGEAFGVPHPWFFHGTALYEENVKVPCIFWSPALFPQGRRSDALGAQVDLNPTLLALLHLPPPGDWQGHSLFDPALPDRRAYFSCNTGNLLVGLRDGDYKFIYNVTLARQELYDLVTDPREQHNRAAADPARCEAYRLRLSTFSTFQRQHLDALAARAAP